MDTVKSILLSMSIVMLSTLSLTSKASTYTLHNVEEVKTPMSGSVLQHEIRLPEYLHDLVFNSKKKVEKAREPLPSSIAIHWGDPTGQRLKVITSLYCPYCEKQQQVLHQLKNIHIEEYLLPQVSQKGHVDFKSAAVWCNENRLEALENAFNSEMIPVFDNCQSDSLKTIADFVEDYQLHGVPIFIRDDGLTHVGFMNERDIKQWLEDK